MKKHKQEKSSANPFSEEEKKDESLNEEETENKKEEVVSDSKLKEDFENLNNQYLRLAADFDNYRKRQAQERESLISYGAEDAMKKLIEVLDNFDRAKASVDKAEDVQQIRESFYVLYNQIFENLSKLGLEVIKAVGEEFDPNLHEAVMKTPTSDVPENHVIMELQKGYKFHDKVLRASLVNVSGGEG